MKRDRRWYDIEVDRLPIRKCASCGEEYFGVAADREIGRAVRRASGVLYAEEIERGRRELGYSQQEFASLISAAAPTVCRWEAAHVVPSKLADTMIRVMLAVPAARRFVQELQRVGRRPEAQIVQDAQFLSDLDGYLGAGVDVGFDIPDDDEPQFALAA